MKQQFSAGIVIFTKQKTTREYLLLHYTAGHWDFAKGKLEPDETNLEAAHRELFEETGLTATIIPGFEDTYSYDLLTRSGEPAHKTVTMFAGTTDNTDVILSHEHQDYIWLSYPEAYKKLTHDNAKLLLEKVEIFLNTKK